MDTSPGTMLVWSLAAREAMLTEMPEINPEHYYCALLKFCELAPEELAGLLQRPSEPAALAAEQGATQRILEAWAIDPRQTRRALRRALGKGGSPPVGGTVHRSAASRELFARAARRAVADGGALEPRHLLAELLDRPTAPMAPFVGQAAERAPAEPKATRKPAPALPPDGRCRPIAALAPVAGFRVPEANAPQVRALLYLLGRPRPPHLLLWVEAGLPLLDLLGQVGEQLGEEQTLFVVDLAALRPQADGAGLAQQVAALAAAYRAHRGACLILDLTTMEAGAARATVEYLQGSLAQPTPRLVLALAAVAATVGRPGPSQEPTGQAPLPAGDVHAVWLHQLPTVRRLERV